MESKVSVIVPVYNVEKYLEKCVKSIVTQDYSNLEIILVDDGSTDQSGEICDRVAEHDARIQVIHKKNGGLSDARNHGIDLASGDFLVFVDSDDYIHESFVRILLETVLRTKSDIAVCKFKEVVEGNESSIDTSEVEYGSTKVYCGTEKNDRLYDDNLRTVVAWNKIYAKHLFVNLRYPVGRLHEDEFVIHRLLYQSAQVAYVDKVLYYYLQRKGSITGNISMKNIKDGYDALQERQDFWRETKQTKAYVQNLANQLFFATSRYQYVRNTYHDKAVMELLKNNIGSQIKDSGLMKLLGQDHIAFFCLFQKHPQLYYYVKEHETSYSFLQRVLRKLIRIRFS